MKNLGDKFIITDEQYNDIIFDCFTKSKPQTIKYIMRKLNMNKKDANELYDVMKLKGELRN